jgi:hypothetical protein
MSLDISKVVLFVAQCFTLAWAAYESKKGNTARTVYWCSGFIFLSTIET